jgi:hypothetical protein
MHLKSFDNKKCFCLCIVQLSYFSSLDLVYADDANILGGSRHVIKKNTETLVVASKEIGLEVNADKTKHLVMSTDQNAEGSHDVKLIIFHLKG